MREIVHVLDGFAILDTRSMTFETVMGYQIWKTAEQLASHFTIELLRYPVEWHRLLGVELVEMAMKAGF